jgi:uncharacterized protein DUF1569
MVETRKVTDRRTLHFAGLNEILEEVEYLASGDPPRASGKWTAPQVVEHVSKFITFSIDGFPMARASLPLRILGRLLRNRALTRPMPPGLKIPRKFPFMVPSAHVTWEQAVETLRTAVARAQSLRMRQRSPVLGKLTHAQWEQFHCRHAEMHLSFLHPN